MPGPPTVSPCLAVIPAYTLAPFGLLLLLIAVMPLAPAWLKARWDHGYPAVIGLLAALVAGYYLVAVPDGRQALLHTGADYGSFLCLIGSLYAIAGGIHVQVRGEATPLANVGFLAVGAVVANVIGTTGASMVLIRPWIRMNKVRISAYHVVFFIFLVSNIGGALTPVGDPPLFLGYLRGVPFFWLAARGVRPWLATVGLVLFVFWLLDRRSFRRLPRRLQAAAAEHAETWQFGGAGNVLLLLVIIGAVFLPPVPGLREIVMVGAAAASLRFTPPAVHARNQFSLGPLKEVAWLFAGIFVTMLPALDFLASRGPALGLTEPWQYYLASGTLSSVLDNAPTYANFFALAHATVAAHSPAAGPALAPPAPLLLAHAPRLVLGVSLGSVFFGAMTYIGNGPNFMVKAIAHESGVHCPSFGGYIFRYSLPLLLPVLLLTGCLLL
ncbi:MAG: sodium:proton antiporter [Verrucomicrobia bacterium]|nr:sodium:proton antiporter [Verrucomicrobiota bacterium]